MPRKTENVRDGWVNQAFRFELDARPAEIELIRRNCGMKRKAYNWTVASLKEHQAARRVALAAGDDMPELGSENALRKVWDQYRNEHCVDAETGEAWWKELSSRSANNGVKDAYEAYWDWVKSLSGKRKGPKVGFPRFKKKGRCVESFRVDRVRLKDRRHVHIPKVGTVRLWENARRLHRLVEMERATIGDATITERNGRFYISLCVYVCRPQRNHKPKLPGSRVGVDLGTRKLAVIASEDGSVNEVVPHSAHYLAKDAELTRLQRRLSRARLRNPGGSHRQDELKKKVSKVHSQVAAQRRDALNKLTTRLAKTHGTIVVEDLNVKGLMTRAPGFGGSLRRRNLADASFGEIRRQLVYKTGWYGSELVVADRFFPSSQFCSNCGYRNKKNGDEVWVCEGCGSSVDRDWNAAVNLAKYRPCTRTADDGVTQPGCGCVVCVSAQTKCVGDSKSVTGRTTLYSASV